MFSNGFKGSAEPPPACPESSNTGLKRTRRANFAYLFDLNTSTKSISMQLNIEKQLFSWWIKCHVLHICSDVSGQGQDKSIKLVNPLFWGHMLGTLCPVLIKTLWMRHLKAWNGDLFSAGWGNEASEERTCSGCHTKTGPTPLTPSCTLHLFFCPASNLCLYCHDQTLYFHKTCQSL